MGLDMYLSGEYYIFKDKERKECFNKIKEIFDDFKDLDIGNVGIKELNFELGYWRKANQIHKWFVDNVQEGEDNCREYYVTREQLQELKDLCEEILKDRTKASELLPNQDGFFFGGTEYDEWYFKDLKETINIINKVLKLPNKFDIKYRSSW